MKKLRITIGLLVALLAVALVWEHLAFRHVNHGMAQAVERRLHAKEMDADTILERVARQDSVSDREVVTDIALVGFRDGKVTDWTDENIGTDSLHTMLSDGHRLQTINNTLYEVRGLIGGSREWFALIRIKSCPPYTNRYVDDRFAHYLRVSDSAGLYFSADTAGKGSGRVIRTQEGDTLFFLGEAGHANQGGGNYLIIGCYFLFFVGLFYAYTLMMRRLPTFRRQAWCVVVFVVLLLSLRYVVLHFHVPACLFRLPLFKVAMPSVEGGSSAFLGDLAISAFAILQTLYITFSTLRVNYTRVRSVRWRYPVMVGLFALTFLYMFGWTEVIRTVIERTDVRLNIANLVDIEWPSIVAFTSIVAVGVGLISLIDGIVNGLKNVFSTQTVILYVTAVAAVFAGLCLAAEWEGLFWGNMFVWLGFVLLTLNRYVVKRDIQRSLSVLIMTLLSVYIVVTSKDYEQYREMELRASYATDLIEERDSGLERLLVEVSQRINDPVDTALLCVRIEREVPYLERNHYMAEITECDADDGQLTEYGQTMEARIEACGQPIGHSSFFLLSEFDGCNAYVGRFSEQGKRIYLVLTSQHDSEGGGYPQILSRRTETRNRFHYPYSYAKYQNGRLISSSGEFNYYRTVDAFGEHGRNIAIVNKDHFSHLIIPVDEEGCFVISLTDKVFSIYYMNIFYALFVCMVLASYGLFFKDNNYRARVVFRQLTLKSRIRSSVVLLIFVLFVILTALSIYLNARNFEDRHRSKAMELARYVNSELEPLDCVETALCPEIQNRLASLSDMLRVDINIYDADGMLVATSRPEIFEEGFAGTFADSDARRCVIAEGSMNFIKAKRICGLGYMSVYMPLVTEMGRQYILNVPYFKQNDELNLGIAVMVIIAVNVAILMMILAIIFSEMVADRVTKPLQMVNDKLRRMRIGGKNEKIVYNLHDDVGSLVRAYNSMVDKLDRSVSLLAKSERETAWREMARQIAHEIKNPLTPMKLNIQFMSRSLQMEDTEAFKKRFRELSEVLIEQIDTMASIATAFSDFAKIPVSQMEEFDVSVMVRSCVTLFEKNVSRIDCETVPDLSVWADKEQVHRVIVNVLQNAVQSIPDDREGELRVRAERDGHWVVVRIRDNGTGIPEEIRDKVFEPNFTTKSKGMGLGLAISRQIMESMGGSIDFESLDIGTEFSITLKAKE